MLRSSLQEFQVSATSFAPANSGTTGAIASMRYLLTPVKRIFSSTGSNKAASGPSTLVKRKETEKTGTKVIADADVFAVDSSSDSEIGSGRPAKFLALSRSPFATPRQPLMFAEDLMTPRTMAPQLQDSRARLSLRREIGREGQVETGPGEERQVDSREPGQTETVTVAQVRQY